jgi:Transglutaminase-like superfamily
MNLRRRLSRLTPTDVVLLTRALFVLVAFRLALSLLPWHRLVPFTTRPPRFVVSRHGAGRLEWAVRWASRLVPRTTCLTEALALNHLLRRDGQAGALRIGVANDGGRFAAHAWVELNGTTLLSSPGVVSRYSRFLDWPTEPDLVP